MSPPSSERIHMSKAHVTELEERYVLTALRSGWIAPLGPDVDRFEAEIAERVGVSSALALSSGTAALHLALLALGVGPDDVVVVPTMTFAASANAVTYTGATPVFVDARPDDGNIDPSLLFDAIDDLRGRGRKVAAVMTVDLFGRCAEYPALVQGLTERAIPLIEDAAEALGARLGGRAAGSFGAVAALSFNGNKIMTTSGGGMLVSDDKDLIARCRYLSTQARQPVPYYQHTEIGYNYRMSNILAGLGRAQLARLDEMIARRREIRDRYADAFADLPGVTLLGREADRADDRDNCWLTAVVLDRARTGIDPAGLIAALDTANIEARHLWKPMHLQPVFADATSYLTGASEQLFDTGLTLPSGSALADADIDRVIGVVGATVGGGR